MGALILSAVVIFSAAGFYFFEKQKVSAEKLVLLAILSAVSAAGRALFAAVPSVQPSSFVIIVTGIVFGAGSGGIVGMTTALLSGLWLGIGPWTPWQMAAWGLMGVSAGILHKPLENKKSLRVIFGAVWGFFFGWIMNVWTVFSLSGSLTEGGRVYVAGVYAASFLFDSFHAAANVTLLWLGGDKFIKTLKRVAVKYGIYKYACVKHPSR